MRFEKLGKLFDVSEHTNGRLTHCMTSFAMPLSNDVYRVYFNSRNENGCSMPFFIEIDMNEPFKILRFSEKPILGLGRYGAFDENGVVFTSYIKKEEEIWFYYSGFPRTAKQIFQAYTGIAVSYDNGLSSKRLFEGPVIGLSRNEPYWAAGPRIYKFNNYYHLFYTSSEGWQKKKGEIVHMYNIKHSISEDGIIWSKGEIAINFQNDLEYAIAIPSIIEEDEKLKMWYSFRAQKDADTYRIGYAESFNQGITWERNDNLMKHFDIEESGWDSNMVGVPFLFKFKEKMYMLYNGNDYGKTGVGLAIKKD